MFVYIFFLNDQFNIFFAAFNLLIYHAKVNDSPAPVSYSDIMPRIGKSTNQTSSTKIDMNKDS